MAQSSLITEINLDGGRVLVEVEIIEPATVRVQTHEFRGPSSFVDYSPEQAAQIGRLMTLGEPKGRLYRLGDALQHAAALLATGGQA